jgi:hypothetical protein
MVAHLNIDLSAVSNQQSKVRANRRASRWLPTYWAALHCSIVSACAE